MSRTDSLLTQQASINFTDEGWNTRLKLMKGLIKYSQEFCLRYNRPLAGSLIPWSDCFKQHINTEDNERRVNFLVFPLHLIYECFLHFRAGIRWNIKNKKLCLYAPLEAVLILTPFLLTGLVIAYAPINWYWVFTNGLKMSSGENEQIDPSCNTDPFTGWLYQPNATQSNCFDDYAYTNMTRWFMLILMCMGVNAINQAIIANCTYSPDTKFFLKRLSVYLLGKNFSNETVKGFICLLQTRLTNKTLRDKYGAPARSFWIDLANNTEDSDTATMQLV